MVSLEVGCEEAVHKGEKQGEKAGVHKVRQN